MLYKNIEMETLNLFNKYPILIDITKDSEKSKLHYGNYNLDFVKSLKLIYQNYFKKSVIVILPKLLKDPDAIYPNLETLENIDVKNNIIIFAWTELIFTELFKINKRRVNTIIKNLNKHNKIHMLSSIDCKIFEIIHLESFEIIKLNEINVLDYNLIDIFDPDQEIYNENIDNLINLINDTVLSGKRVYLSMDLSQSKLCFIESKLKETVSISRKEDSNCSVIINSIKTTENTILNDDYSVYFFIFPIIIDPIELIPLIKDIIGKNGIEIYIDSTKNKNFTSNLKSIFNFSKEKFIIKDSGEYNTYQDCIKLLPETECIVASEEYRYFDASESILQTLNLSNLSKKDTDLIKNYIKIKLPDLDIKSCHLITPCSPKGTSKKLNSIANKINQSVYRCEITCEIFTDYTIGVIEWNEMFCNKSDINVLNVLKNSVYIYQTTSNKWKFTTVKSV